MGWMKVDDRFHSSHKLNAIPARQRFQAAGLWVIAGSWASSQETDGEVPMYMLKQWGATAKTAEALVLAGLWSRTQDGFRFCSWLDYNPSKADTAARRAANAERKRLAREAKAAKRAGQRVGEENVPADTPETVPSIPTRPDPTRPDPTPLDTYVSREEPSETPPSSESPAPSGAEDHAAESSEPEAPMAAAEAAKPKPRKSPKYPDPNPELDGAFDEFWSAYPRRSGKRDARGRYEEAISRGATVEDLLAGAQRYRDDPSRSEKFTKLPTTWLNQDCYLDETRPADRPATTGPLQGGQLAQALMSGGSRAPVVQPGQFEALRGNEGAA
ncbi:hypothetical protein SEA_MOLLYMUR_88 [Gordonia phage Mollymur]|uniref:Uncharacterized protein n=1 Tax=Gordonia phage Mollymur TaxID=2590895 RepID=A0A4Y6EA39_9CAUD|nr:hypothetical protein PQB84_gp038 [Gordonia phage Mollymur]QDF15448.1 hypothetical protein SEA_MOLLYMUR_88 [Gordonia phage Mollymur]